MLFSHCHFHQRGVRRGLNCVLNNSVEPSNPFSNQNICCFLLQCVTKPAPPSLIKMTGYLATCYLAITKPVRIVIFCFQNEYKVNNDFVQIVLNRSKWFQIQANTLRLPIRKLKFTISWESFSNCYKKEN